MDMHNNPTTFLFPPHFSLYHRSAARTIEYSYNDFCVAQVAIGLNKTEDYDKYMSRSDNWQNLWNNETESYGFTGFIIPRNSFSREFLTNHWADPTLCSPSKSIFFCVLVLAFTMVFSINTGHRLFLGEYLLCMKRGEEIEIFSLEVCQITGFLLIHS